MEKLYVFVLSAEHTLHDAGTVTLQSRFYGLACTRRENDTLVAFGHGSSVSLQRLASSPQRLEPLASVNLAAPWRVLFLEELLLVADWNTSTQEYSIVLFRALGDALTERRVLLKALQSVYIFAWTLARDRLVLADLNSGDLLVYDFRVKSELRRESAIERPKAH